MVSPEFIILLTGMGGACAFGATVGYGIGRRRGFWEGVEVGRQRERYGVDDG